VPVVEGTSVSQSGIPACCPERYTIRAVQKWCRRHAVGLAVLFAVLALVLGGAVVVQAVMLHARDWRIVGGTVPDWLEALGGLATVAALAIAWLVYRRDARNRRNDETTRRKEDHRKQAELITGWLNDHIEMGLTPDREHHVRLDLINASQGVVYDIFVRVIGEPADPFSVGGAAPEHREARGFLHVLPPRTCSVSMRMPDITERVMGLQIYFRDARNQRWMRDTSGMLQPSKGDPFPVVRDAFWRVKAPPLTHPNIAIQTLWCE
jgi:hypothetical protein